MKVVESINLPKIVYMFDQESLIEYFRPETEYYQSSSKEDLSFDPSAIGPFYQAKWGKLYSTEHNAFMCWKDGEYDTLFKFTNQILSELGLNCSIENDEEYIDPNNTELLVILLKLLATSTKFTSEMIQKALQCGTVIETRIPTLSSV